MTVLCGGGTSSAKTGVAETIIFTAGSLSSLLNNKGGYWATLAAPLLGVLAYSATDLCGTDPPAQPTITDDEYKALLQLQPWDVLVTALGKLADIVTRVIWYDLCECDAGAQPILPTDTLDPPDDVDIPNYGGGDCPRPRTRINVPINSGTPVRAYTNCTRQFFPSFPASFSVAHANYDSQEIFPIPTNWTDVRLVADYVSGTTSGAQSYHVDFYVFDATRVVGGILCSASVTSTGVPHGVSGASPTAINTGTYKYFALNSHCFTPITVPGVIDVEVQLTCTAGAPPLSGCCSDPTVIALLSQLMQQVNLIQRQNAPFAYIGGEQHIGLTGSGQFSVQGLLGMRVELTAVSTVVGVSEGVPEQTFEAGWIAWGNGDGFTQREFITNESFVSFPALAGQYTTFAYNLSVGVEATFSELNRER